MNNLEARIILEKLFEGVHPETGGGFRRGSCLQ